MSSALVGWLLFGVFLSLTLLAVFASGIQLKRGNRHKATHDYGSIYYLFAMLLMAASPAIAWHLGPWTPTTRGLVAGGVALVVDALFLGLGVVYERWRDKGKDEVGQRNSGKSSRNGRFYSIEGSTARLFFRFLVVLLVHGGAYAVGGYAQSEVGNDVPALFWPWFITYFGVLFFALGGIYLIITVFFKWQDYYFGAGLPPSDAESGGESTQLLRDTARRSPPVEEISEAGSRVVGATPVALRTRRRTAADKESTSSSTKKRYDFD